MSGIVQGVGYRFFAVRAAGRAGVAGYVKNLRDGRVEVYAIGAPEALRSLKADLERGPRAALVERVEESEAPLEQRFAADFSVEYDGC